MKIVLGIEGREGAFGPASGAERLLRQLRFTASAVDVVHVYASPSLINGAGSLDVLFTTEGKATAERAAQDWAHDLVEATAARLGGRQEAPSHTCPYAFPQDIPKSDPARAGEGVFASVRGTVLCRSSATGGLIEAAQVEGADLIAVDRSHSGPLRALLSGSVARALLVDSPVSLLIARQEPDNEGQPLRVVFATDHSSYANRCLEELVRLAPRGIGHLVVLSVYPKKGLRQAQERLQNDLLRLPLDLVATVRRDGEAKNAAALQRLSPLLKDCGATGETRLVIEADSVPAAIEETMRETESDLLVLGARGHGFSHRIRLGSVSFHLAMTAPYSLLLLRPKDTSARVSRRLATGSVCVTGDARTEAPYAHPAL